MGSTSKWLRKAAEQDSHGAQFNLGEMYENGLGVPQNYVKAAKWYSKGAELGHAKAQFNLGAMYDKGQGVSQNLIYAHMWYNLAATSGHSDARKARERTAKNLKPAQITKAQELAREWWAKHPKKEVAPRPHRPPSAPPKMIRRKRLRSAEKGTLE